MAARFALHVGRTGGEGCRCEEKCSNRQSPLPMWNRASYLGRSASRAGIHRLRVLGDQILLISASMVGGNDLLRLYRKLLRHLKCGPAKSHGQGPVSDDVLIANDTCGNALSLETGPQDMRLPRVKIASDCRKHDLGLTPELSRPAKRYGGMIEPAIQADLRSGLDLDELLGCGCDTLISLSENLTT